MENDRWEIPEKDIINEDFLKMREKSDISLSKDLKKLESNNFQIELLKRKDEKKNKNKNKKNNNIQQNQGELWTTKYEPKKISDLIGNKTNINKLITWLDDWNSVVLEGNTKKV